MFCLQTWTGVVCTTPSTPNKPNNPKVEVWTRLGGGFLGFVDKPDCQSYRSVYYVLRNLQDQVAKFFSHPTRPSRYIALFVGDTRLTSPGFPFAESDDNKGQLLQRNV